MDVRFLEGIEANLPTTITDGNIYYCTDTAKLYIDMNGERKCVSSSSSDENKYLWRQWAKAGIGGFTTTALTDISNIGLWSNPYYYTGTFDKNNYGYANGTEEKVSLNYDGVIFSGHILHVGNEISINSDSTISITDYQSFNAYDYADSTREANFEPYYVVDTGITISAGKYFYLSSADSVPKVFSVAESIQLPMIATLNYDPNLVPTADHGYAWYNYRFCTPKNETTGSIPDVYQTTATYSTLLSSNPTLFESDDPNFMTNSDTDTALTESLGKRGELEKKAAYIELGSYIGTGSSSVTLTFRGCPKIVMITRINECAILFRDKGQMSTEDVFNGVSRSFTGNKLRWSATSLGSHSNVPPMNTNRNTYNVLAIY